jgi:glycosyltransferase involved in cell wall biosynthesis
MTLRPRVLLVVPIRNAMKYLPATVESFIAAVKHYGNAELVLVDNGSTDGTWERLLAKYSAQARILRLAPAIISAVRNHGAAAAECDFLSFIDADCLIAPDYFDQAMAFFNEAKVDVSGSRHELPEKPNWIEETWEGLLPPSKEGTVLYIPSGNFMLRQEAFEAVGGFNEALVTGEDAEICQRLRHAGYSVVSSSRIRAVHLGNPQDLAQFFRKEVWHGLGMFGTFRWREWDKPVMMTVVHLLACVGALMNLAWGPGGWEKRMLISLLLTTIAPAASVAYRYAVSGCVYRPLRSLFLYHLYLAARVFALLEIVMQGILPARQKEMTAKSVESAVGRDSEPIPESRK